MIIKALVPISIVLSAVITLAACDNSRNSNHSDQPVIEAIVHKALTSFRANEDGVHDYYFEIEKVLKDGDQVASIARYKMQQNGTVRKLEWKNTLTPLQSKAHRVTGTLVRGDKLFLSGYYTLSMDGDLSELTLNSQANGFLIKVDAENGTILGATALGSQTALPNSTVIPLAIDLYGEDIVLTGKTSGGIAIGNMRLEPESALDHFEIALEPDTLDVLSASLTPLTSNAAITANYELLNKPKSIILDFLGNFEANAVTQWAQSSILNKLGFPNAVQTQLGQINSQLNTINTNISNIQSQLNTLLGDFATLYNTVLQATLGSNDTLYTYFYNNMGTYYQGYINAVNNALPPGQPETDLTIQMVAADTSPNGAVESFAAYFNGYNGTTAQVTMTTLGNNLKDMVSTLYNTGTSPTSGLLASLNQQALASLQESNYGTGSFDLVSTFDGYNESLMNVYANAVQAIQMAYTIQSTFVYLASVNPSYFSGWVIPITGVESSYDYATNQVALNTYYEQQFQNVFNYVANYLITDSYDTLPAISGLNNQPTITYQAGFTPMPANTLTGMPQNNQGSFTNATPWTQACAVYIWSGASTNPFESGTYNNNLLTAQCNTGGTQQTVEFALNAANNISNTPINFYWGPGLGGNYVPWLQAQQWSSSYLTSFFDPTDFDGAYGYAQTLYPPPTSCIIISGMGWNPFPSANTVYPITSSGYNITPGNYCTNSKPGWDGYGGWIIEGFISPLGLSGFFWIGSEYQSDLDVLGTQVQCGGNDWLESWCEQGQGFVASNGAYVSYVCIGGYQLQLYSMGTTGTQTYLSIGDTRNCMASD
jgi:hypothetical protein